MSERRTFRATGITIVMVVIVVTLALLTIIVGLALPESASFSTFQTATIWLLIGCVALFGWTVARSKVVADDDRLVVVNGFRTHVLTWPEVAAISLKDGAPWPVAVTHDDRRVALFAIQGSDGESAREAARWLQGHVR